MFLTVWLAISCFPWLLFHRLFGGCRATPSGKQTDGSFLAPEMLQSPLFRCHTTAAKQGRRSCKMVHSETESCCFWSCRTWVSHDLHAEGMSKIKGIIATVFWDVLQTKIRESFARINKESREKNKVSMKDMEAIFCKY